MSAPGDQIESHVSRLSANGSLSNDVPPLAYGGVKSQASTSPFSAAWNGREILMAWSIRASKELTNCMYTQRFTAEGNPLAGQQTLRCVDGGSSDHPRVVWDGRSRWVIQSNFGAAGGIHAQKLLADGTADGSPIEIARGDTAPANASAVATPAGIFVAYTRVDAAAGYVRRAFFRRLTEIGKPRATMSRERKSREAPISGRRARL